MTSSKSDRLAGIILLLVAVLWIAGVFWTIPEVADGARVGPRGFPLAMGVLLAALSLFLIVSSYFTTAIDEPMRRRMTGRPRRRNLGAGCDLRLPRGLCRAARSIRLSARRPSRRPPRSSSSCSTSARRSWSWWYRSGLRFGDLADPRQGHGRLSAARLHHRLVLSHGRDRFTPSRTRRPGRWRPALCSARWSG